MADDTATPAAPAKDAPAPAAPALAIGNLVTNENGRYGYVVGMDGEFPTIAWLNDVSDYQLAVTKVG